MTHFEASDFISDQQHSFRRGFSTVTQHLYTVNEFAKALDREGQIDVIFLDFAKSFERQLHQKLQIKLKAILNNERLVRWLDSYLSNCYQFVEVGGVSSPTVPVISAVPQGSVLSPLPFFVYINDIASDSDIQCRFYANDCVLVSKLLGSHLCRIPEWCKNWQMSLDC